MTIIDAENVGIAILDTHGMSIFVGILKGPYHPFSGKCAIIFRKAVRAMKNNCMTCKWQAEDNIIRADDGTHIAEASDRDTAQQIVLEHNAHGELVELAKEWRDRMAREPAYNLGYELGDGKVNAIIHDVHRISDVLKRAEGR